MDPQFFYNLLADYLVPLSTLVPIFFGLKNYISLSAALKILWVFIVYSTLFNLANLLAISLYHIHTVKWVPVFTVSEFSFIALIFSRIFNKKWRPIFYVIIAIFAIVCLLNSVFIQNKLEFNTYTRPIGALMIVAFCMTYTIKQGTIEKKWSDDSFNWVNTGFLLYYAVGFVLFIAFNYFLIRNIYTDIIWAFHNIILIMEYLLFAVGFSRCRSQITTT